MREPAWHHRERQSRRDARTLLRVNAGRPTPGDQSRLREAEAALQQHHGSRVPMAPRGNGSSGKNAAKNQTSQHEKWFACCGDAECGGWQDLREVDLQKPVCPTCEKEWPKAAIRKAARAQKAPLPKDAAASAEGDQEDPAAAIATFQRLVQEGKIQGATALQVQELSPAPAAARNDDKDVHNTPPNCRETQREFNGSFAELQRLYRREGELQNAIQRKQRDIEVDQKALEATSAEVSEARAKAAKAAASLTDAFCEYERQAAEKRAAPADAPNAEALILLAFLI